MTSQIDDDKDYSLESTRWMDRLRDERNASEAERRAFLDFIAKSPHAAAQVVSDLVVDEVMRTERPWGQQSREERIALARAAVAREDAAEVSNAANDDVAPPDPADLPAGGAAAPEQKGGEQARRRLGWAVAATALLGAIGTVVWLANQPAPSSHYAASLNSPEVVTLADGTQVALAAATQIDVEIDESQRNVRMTGGEAEFRVFRDGKRRFRVHTPHGTIAVLGTVFKVSVKDKGLDVDVTEGRVELTGRQRGGQTLLLSAGEQASVLANGRIQLVSKLKSSPVSSVRPPAPRVFTRASLAEIARAFNEQHGRTVIEVKGSACLVTMSGVLYLTDPEDFVREIGALAAVVVEKREGVIVIRGSKDAEGAEEAEISCIAETG